MIDFMRFISVYGLLHVIRVMNDISGHWLKAKVNVERKFNLIYDLEWIIL